MFKSMKQQKFEDGFYVIAGPGGLLEGQGTIRGSTGWCIAYFSFRNSQYRLV